MSKRKGISIKRHRDGSITFRSTGGIDLRPILHALAGEAPIQGDSPSEPMRGPARSEAGEACDSARAEE